MERINVSEVALMGNELKYLKECVETKWISSEGPFVKRFEAAFAEYCGTKYATSVSNGTHALHLALAAQGIKEGDEVIVPALTFIATANAVKYIGAEPVLADVDKTNWNIDVNQLESLITKKTKAIIPVHLFGVPCDMGKINEIAERHNLFVLEDAAQALGSEYEGKKSGNLGSAAIFSLYGNKIITTGEGGMITSNDKELCERAFLLKNHAMRPERRYYHEELGFNYRMTNLQAAFGLAQIEGITKIVDERQKIANIYYKKFKNNDKIIVPKKANAGNKHNYWSFAVLLRKEYGISPKELADKLKQEGIETRPFFTSLSRINFLNKKNQPCPIAEGLTDQGIILPTFSGISEKQIDFICNKIKQFSEES